MKKKKIQSFHTKTVKELVQMIQDIQKELVRLRIDWGGGKLKDVHQIKKKSRELARVKTVLKNKELLGLEKEGKVAKSKGSNK